MSESEGREKGGERGDEGGEGNARLEEEEGRREKWVLMEMEF